MKYSNKIMIIFLFMLASFGRDIAAYTFTFTNMTGRDVKVQLHYAFGSLNKEPELIEAYDSRKFSFKGIRLGLCLSKLTVASFDEEKDKWIPLSGAMPMPIKIVDDTLFEETRSAIGAFNKEIKSLTDAGVSVATAVGSVKGTIIAKAVSKAIDGLADTVEGAMGLVKVSFCKSRDFILVLDEMIIGGKPLMIAGEPMMRVFALTPPE